MSKLEGKNAPTEFTIAQQVASSTDIQFLRYIGYHSVPLFKIQDVV
jgi:hypothetical protein